MTNTSLGVRYDDSHLTCGGINTLKRDNFPKLTNIILGKAGQESKCPHVITFVQSHHRTFPVITALWVRQLALTPNPVFCGLYHGAT